MGQSLAVAAVRGTTSNQTIAEQKQALLSAGDTEGLISLNHLIFGGATMMAKEDDADDGDDGDDGDDDGDDSDDGDDGDDDDDDDKGKGKPDPKDERIKELSAEAKKRRLRVRTQAQKIADLEAENARLKKGSKPAPKKADDKADDEDDASSEELEAERAKNKALEERLVRTTLKSEFTSLITGDKALVTFIDPKAAFRLLDLDDVEIDEDGEIDGLDEAIKDLAKKSPYLVAKPKGKDDDDDDDDDEDEKPKRRRTGQPTGSRKKGNPNREKLLGKYPALRR